MGMKETTFEEIDLEKELLPETELEQELLRHPEFVKGLFWGVPRFGHPEGNIYKHIKEVLQNIEALSIDDDMRRQLRLIAYTHDTFKFQEDKGYPRDWSKHHGIIARRFLSQFIDDSSLLEVVELHDEAYYSWRLTHLYNSPEKGGQRLEWLLDRLGPNLQLFYIFFKCDTRTGDKNQAPLKWFENTVKGIQIVDF